MPAFNKNRAFQLKQIIRRLGTRIINAHRVEMTSDEMFELYTKEEDREILTKVFTLVAMGSDQTQLVAPVQPREAARSSSTSGSTTQPATRSGWCLATPSRARSMARTRTLS